MLNRITLQGRLVADPELRNTPSGVPVATFKLAVERDRKNKETGEKETDFIPIVAWRQTAEFAKQYFSKGRMAVVEGRLQLRNYTDRDGNNRTIAEVQAENIYFSDSRPVGGDAGGGYAAQAPSYGGNFTGGYGTPTGDQFAELSQDDGELPF